MKKTVLKIISLALAMTLLASMAACGVAVAEAETAGDGTDVIGTIMTAGTTQAFSDEAVPEADVKAILQAGLAAESAINQQPWYFVAITDKDVMAEISGSGSGSTFTPPSGGTMPANPPGGDMPGAPSGGTMPANPPGGEMPGVPSGGTVPANPPSGSMPGTPQGGAPSFSSGGAKASLGDSPLAVIVYMNKNTSSPDPSFDCGLAVQNMYIAAASLGYGAKIVSSPTRSLNGADHDRICGKLGVDTSLTAVAVLLIGKPADGVDGVSGATTRAALEEKTSIIG